MSNDYGPEIRVVYDNTEPAGYDKTASVPRRKKVAGQWVDDPSKPKKEIAKIYNSALVRFRFRGPFMRDGEIPIINGRPFVVWRVDVGTIEEGAFVEEVENASFIDSSTDQWVTARLQELMAKHLQPDDDPRDFVFNLGKRPGTKTAAAVWFVDFVGKIEEMEDTTPSTLAVASTVTTTKPTTKTTAGTSTANDDLTEIERDVVDRVNITLKEQNLTLTQYAEQYGKTPEALIEEILTTGMAKDDDGEPITLDADRAKYLAANAKAAGFDL